MNRTALLLPLALLGLTSTAFAGIDDVAASSMDGQELDLTQTEDRQERTTTKSSRSKGNKTATRETATNRAGTKQGSRVTYSNGNKSHTKSRGRAKTSSGSSAYGNHGDEHHRKDTQVKVRGKNTTTNGHKTVTQKRGANKHHTGRRGVQDGESYSHRSSSGTHRTNNVAHNARTGRKVTSSSRTTGNRELGRSGGVKTVDRKSTQRSTRFSDTHPQRGNLALAGRTPTMKRGNAHARGTVTRSTSTRPGTAGPRTTRPGTATVRPSGTTRTTTVRSRPSTRTTRVTTTGVRHRRVTYTTVRPYHGVFVYGPRPTHHHHYHSNGPAQVRTKHMPDRAVERANSVAVGLKMGSLASGYDNGAVYGDLGVGLAGRYRPAESVGLQLDVTHHAQSWASDTERSQTVGAASVQLFAFPWTRVSPYALGGVTYDARNLQDNISGGTTVIANDSLWGLHGGLGVEFALGQSVALDLEGRYIGYLDKSPNDPSLPGALQLTGGLMFHF